MVSQSTSDVKSAVAPSRRRRLFILAICCTSLLLVSMDVTIVNVALPSIHRAFHASLDGLQWTLDAYTLVIACLLMLAGSSADRFGRKRVFLIGLVVFTAGSAMCAAAPSLGFLVAARIIQAIGGSMLNPVAMSIIRTVFDDPRERAQAIGIWGAVVGISSALGPVIGGILVDGPGWRFVFLVNVPIGIVALVLTKLYVPESRAPKARRFDPGGQVLVIIWLATLVYAIIEGARDGWTSGLILGSFAVALLSLVGLILYERRQDEPLLELRFFRSIPFASASLSAICSFAGLGGFLFLATLYLQSARGFSALHAGLYSLPMALTMIVLAPLSGRIVGGSGARWPLVFAGIFMAAGSLILLGLNLQTSVILLLVAYFLRGAGVGLVNPPISVIAVSGMPGSQAGVAGAIASTSRQIGFALGVAIVGAVSGGTETGSIGPSFAAATHAGWAVLSVLGFIVLVLGWISTTKRALDSAERTAKLFDGSDGK
ncbi:MAG TPA: MFS transporter [Acidimicrobiales bacterium]|jgi:EmrB/QacA subfamily drug resistance transporter